MAKFAFDLVSPERQLMSTEVEVVSAPGTEGDFGVYAGHAPMITTLRSGIVEIEGAEGGDQRIYIAGGLAQVTNDRMVVLAEEAVMVADLSRDDLQQRIQNTKEDLEDASDDEVRRIAEAKLAHLEELLAVL
jgi:F-type H+-transporting ATPase subunit epsilon